MWYKTEKDSQSTIFSVMYLNWIFKFLLESHETWVYPFGLLGWACGICGTAIVVIVVYFLVTLQAEEGSNCAWWRWLNDLVLLNTRNLLMFFFSFSLHRHSLHVMICQLYFVMCDIASFIPFIEKYILL